MAFVIKSVNVEVISEEQYQAEVTISSVKRRPKLRPWVKVVAASIVLSISLGAVADMATTSDRELAKEVHWVDKYAQPGDGYEKMVRAVNGDKDLDIKAMSSIMQEKNHGRELKAGMVYQVPVLEAK